MSTQTADRVAEAADLIEVRRDFPSGLVGVVARHSMSLNELRPLLQKEGLRMVFVSEISAKKVSLSLEQTKVFVVDSRQNGPVVVGSEILNGQASKQCLSRQVGPLFVVLTVSILET